MFAVWADLGRLVELCREGGGPFLGTCSPAHQQVDPLPGLREPPTALTPNLTSRYPLTTSTQGMLFPLAVFLSLLFVCSELRHSAEETLGN